MSYFLLRRLIFLFLPFGLSFNALSNTQPLPIFVDIRDITYEDLRGLPGQPEPLQQPKFNIYLEYNCQLLDGLKKRFCLLNNEFIYDNFDSHPEREQRLIDFRPQPHLAPVDLLYTLKGANKYQQLDPPGPRNSTLSVQLEKVDKHFQTFGLSALILYEGDIYIYRFEVNWRAGNFFQRAGPATTELLQAPHKFSADIGLIDKAMLVTVEGKNFNLQKIYPVSVPGFNYNENQLKALPLNVPFVLANFASLNTNSKSFKQRSQPSHYDDLPFVKILDADFNYFSFGFHSTLGSSVLNRGFLSAGCYRMRPKDIIEFYFLFQSLTARHGTTTTRQYLPHRGLAHPYPVTEKLYAKEKYPDGKKGEKGITAMTTKYLFPGETVPEDKLENYFLSEGDNE